jgi:hypothetical protein
VGDAPVIASNQMYHRDEIVVPMTLNKRKDGFEA